jgi:hypothetical protein
MNMIFLNQLNNYQRSKEATVPMSYFSSCFILEDVGTGLILILVL